MGSTPHPQLENKVICDLCFLPLAFEEWMFSCEAAVAAGILLARYGVNWSYFWSILLRLVLLSFFSTEVYRQQFKLGLYDQ